MNVQKNWGMSNMFNIEPENFPDCPSCARNIDVDVDEISEKFVCRYCCVEWSENDD